MFRDLIPLLADRFHLVAPDLPGFRPVEVKPRDTFTYTFDAPRDGHRPLHGGDGAADLRALRLRLRRAHRLPRGHGAPGAGDRTHLAEPANAYEEGLSEGWNPIQRYWRDRSDANRQALRDLLTPASIRWQYEHGVPDTSLVSPPDGSALDAWYIQRPEVDEIQLDLFATMPATWRSTPPSRPISARTGRGCWRSGAGTTRSSCRRRGGVPARYPGCADPFPGYGHFALETHADEIAQAIAGFLDV